MDAGYLVSNNGGSIISDNGASVVAVSGKVIAAGGGAILSNNSAGIISDNGASLIDLATGLISDKGLGYRTLQSGAQAGQMLPVKGMAVVPISLVTGAPLGKAVLTDGQGGYQIAVPEAEEKNVLIFTAVPGESASDPRLSDPRLRLGVIVNPQKPKQAVIDEDTASLSRYMLLSLINRIERIFEMDDITAATELLVSTMPELPAVLKQVLAGALGELKAVADEAEFKRMTDRDKQRFLHNLTDMIVAHVVDPDLDELPVKANHLTRFTAAVPPIENRAAAAVFLEIIAHMRPFVQAKLNTDPAYFEKRDYMIKANAHLQQTRPGATPYAIKRSSDITDFIVRAYLSQNYEDGQVSGLEVDTTDGAADIVFTDIGAQTMPVTNDPTDAVYNSSLLLRAAYLALLENVTQTMLKPDVKKATIDRMKAYQRLDPLKP